MSKLIDIKGIIKVNDNMDKNKFYSVFTQWIKNNGFSFDGEIEELLKENEYKLEVGDYVYEITFPNKIIERKIIEIEDLTEDEEEREIYYKYIDANGDECSFVRCDLRSTVFINRKDAEYKMYN